MMHEQEMKLMNRILW